jgi:2-oxo-4-hydroxy-4-carboxy-5-ureidoimidazoline decarboxylase
MEIAHLTRLNSVAFNEAVEYFRRCCGTDSWCRQMAECRPFSSLEDIHLKADACLDRLSQDGWLEAFACHPQIGDVNSLRMKYAGNREWSANEQSGVSIASEETLTELAKGNADYKKKFGFIFIVCASGKSASEMLAILSARLPLSIDEEIANAAREQRKITHLRIDKLEIKTL